MGKLLTEVLWKNSLFIFFSLIAIALNGWSPKGIHVSLGIALVMLVLLFSWSFIFTQLHNRLFITVLFVLMLWAAIREFANIFFTLGIDVQGKPGNELECLYFSVYAWTGFGFIDMKPTDKTQLCVAIEVSCGYIMNAALFAIFVNLIRPWHTQP